MNLSLVNGNNLACLWTHSAFNKVNGKRPTDFEKVEPDPMGIS